MKETSNIWADSSSSSALVGTTTEFELEPEALQARTVSFVGLRREAAWPWAWYWALKQRLGRVRWNAGEEWGKRGRVLEGYNESFGSWIISLLFNRGEFIFPPLKDALCVCVFSCSFSLIFRSGKMEKTEKIIQHKRAWNRMQFLKWALETNFK